MPTKSDFKIPKTGQRFVTDSPVKLIADNRIEFSFASTHPVDRNYFLEVLRMEGLDDSRVKSGVCPFLLNHDTGLILGRILEVWQAGNTLRCVAEVGTTPTAKEYGPDVLAGLLRGVSCRYKILDARTSIDAEGRDVLEVRQWELLEILVASVAADPSVGIGRSFTTQRGASEMPTAARTERERIRAIEAMAAFYSRKFNVNLERGLEIERQAVDEELSETEARSLFAQEVEKVRGTRGPIESCSKPLPQLDGFAPGEGYTHQRGGVLGLSEADKSKYSVMRAINAQLTSDWSRAGFERECHQALLKEGFRSNGIMIPTEALRAPALTTSQSYAGSLVGTQHMSGDFIDALRANSIILQLGSYDMPGLQGNVDIPRQSGVSSLGWVAENTDLPESGPSFDSDPASTKNGRRLDLNEQTDGNTI